MQNNYYNATHPLRPYTHSLAAMPGTVAPANALRGKRPKVKAGFWPGEQSGKWVDIEDHRGEEGYVNGEAFTVFDFGPYPQGWATTPPEPTEEEKAAQRRAEIIARFAHIDFDSVRPLRAIVQGEGTEADKEKLAALDAEAEELRTELAALPAA